MSGYLFFDTETTGLADFTKPADADGQPRLAQLALIFCDQFLNIESEHLFLIKPDGWEMPDTACAIHGLTNEHLRAHGVNVIDALHVYSSAIIAGRQLVGHNVQYDAKVMRGELRRAQMPDLYNDTKVFCTMRALTDICRLPKASGRGFKFPKLAEAASYCLEIFHEHAHNAMADAKITVLLAQHLHKIGRFPA